MWIELWMRHIITRRPYDFEILCQRILQIENPELYAERRGGTGDLGRDLVIKNKRSETAPHGICQVSTETPWQHKFRKELRQLVQRFERGDIKTMPDRWIFLTTQDVHEKKKPSRNERPRDKDDELTWAQGFLRNEAISDMEIEIWGFQDLVEVVAHPHRGKLIRDDFGLSGFFGEGLDDWLEAIQDYTEGRLDREAARMPILEHIPRVERDLLRRSLEDDGATLMIGEGGTGKTGIVTLHALELMEQDHPVLYLRATGLATTIGNPDQIGAQIGVARPFVQVIRTIAHATGAFYLFFDQLGFVLGTELSRTLCGLAQTVAGIDGAYVVVVSRTYQAGMRGEIQELPFPKVEVRPIARKAVRELLKRLDIAEPSEVLLALADNTLNLLLIAELVEGGINVGDIDSEPELWNRYRESIEKLEGADALKRAIEHAASSLAMGRRQFAVFAPDEDTQKLISRGVIVEANSHIFRFRHERLQDYLYAWGATREGKMAPDVLAEIDEVAEPGVIDWIIQIYEREAPERAVRFADEVFDG